MGLESSEFEILQILFIVGAFDEGMFA